MTVKPPCVLLAGGQSRRMGGEDKFLKPFGDSTLLGHIVSRLEPQVSDIMINANRPLKDVPYPVEKDIVDGQRGPLAGILTGLTYFSQKDTDATHLLCFPCDIPFVPLDLVQKLQDKLGAGPHSIAMAYSGNRIHPVISLWPFALLDQLREALVVEDLRKILVFAERYQLTSAKWTGGDEDPFFNVNTPGDLLLAKARLQDEG